MHYVSSTVGWLAQKFGGLGLSGSDNAVPGSRVFFPTDGDVLTTDTPIEVDLAVCLTTLRALCDNRVNEAFYYLHQRSAPIGSIDVEHKKLQAELAERNERVRQAWEHARGLYQHIPHISNPQTQAEALSHMMDIEMLAFKLTKNHRALCAVLSNTERNQALEYYKKTIKACEELASLYTIEEKVRALDGIAAGVLDTINQAHPAEVGELYDAILLFIRYTAYRFKKAIPEDNAALLLELQTLDAKIKEKIIDKTALDFDTPTPAAEDPALPENVYLANASTTALPPENAFRRSPWLKQVTTLAYIGRYAAIAPQIERLEGIAKGLFALERSVEAEMNLACSTEGEQPYNFQALKVTLAHDTLLCQGLERLIGVERRALAEVELAKKVHAGWNYAACLLTQAKVIRATIQEFQTMSTNLELHVTALRKLKCHLQERAPSLRQICDMMTLIRLNQAATAVSRITDPINADNRVYVVVKETLDEVGPLLLRYTTEELQIPDLVFSRNCGKNDGFFASLQIYLMKGFLKHLVFPHDLSKKSNPEFEAVLFMMKYDRMYKQIFDTWCRTSDEFAKRHEAYMKQSDMDTHLQQMKKMSTMLKSLSTEPLHQVSTSRNVAAGFIRYYKLRNALADVDTMGGKTTPSERLRLDWIGGRIETVSHQLKYFIETDRALRSKNGEGLHNALFTDLFILDPKLCQRANKLVRSLIEQDNFNLEELHDSTRLLLYRWTLERFVTCSQLSKADNLKIPKAELQILATFFREYMGDEEKRAYWRKQYDIGYMEVALQEFTRRYQLTRLASEDPNRILLQKVASYYSAFRKIVKEQEYYLAPESPAHRQASELFAQAMQCFCNNPNIHDSTPTTRTTYDLAIFFCKEMHDFLYATRFSFRKE